MKSQKNNSVLVQYDALSERTYKLNNFNPENETTKLSYTSGRVAKRVYNSYSPPATNDYKVFGYYTDWSQYDGRLDNQDAPGKDCGRGIDISLLKADAYDKLIIGFLGVVGDHGEKKETIEKAATCNYWPSSTDVAGFCKGQFNVVFTDPWGDVLSYRNCGFAGWRSNDVPSMYTQQQAQGVLGALRDLKKLNPNLRLGISIGGWTMSQIFHHLARAPEQRAVFIDSIIDILQKFPMITDLDIDWEYPGMLGNNNDYADDDSLYFQVLIKELKLKLNQHNYSDIKISIAVNASIEGLEKADIPGMIESGVEGINLMTYDFFGTPWADSLAHHSNLHNFGNNQHFNIDTAVDYLESKGVDLKKVYIGYVAYSRSAKNTNIESYSPLVGTYLPGSDTTTGSFESGVTEWYDILYNYFDFENKTGRNGYELLTDEVADADYLYSASSRHFISIDTPRTVKAKGEYVQKRGLGGLFTWTADMDNGLLVNAAREGLGYRLSHQVIDMSEFYFKGTNVTPSEHPVARIEGQTRLAPGDELTLSGASSANAISYLWKAPGVPFDGQQGVIVQALIEKEGTYEITLTVTSAADLQDSKTIVVEVRSNDIDETISLWEPKNYPVANTKVRHNYNGTEWSIYENRWFANSNEEPGNPIYTGVDYSGKVWKKL